MHRDMYPKQFVPLIDCLMGARSPPSAAAACLDRLDISNTTAEEVGECANSDEGSNLLHELGVETGPRALLCPLGSLQ